MMDVKQIPEKGGSFYKQGAPSRGHWDLTDLVTHDVNRASEGFLWGNVRKKEERKESG